MGIRSLRTASISTGVKRSKVWDQSAIVTNIGQLAYESIQTVTVGSGGSSTITFSSIPNTYKHLQIRAIARGGSASTLDAIKLTFNGDGSSSNYVTLHQLYGSGSGTPASQSSTSNGWIYQSYITGANATSNVFGTFVTDIFDYSSTNKNKTTRTLAGSDQNGSGFVTFGSGLWMNSSTAINSITMVVDGGSNFAQPSQFALYGIKG